LVKNVNGSLPLKTPSLLSVFGYDAVAPPESNLAEPLGGYRLGFLANYGYRWLSTIRYPFNNPGPIAPNGSKFTFSTLSYIPLSCKTTSRRNILTSFFPSSNRRWRIRRYSTPIHLRPLRRTPRTRLQRQHPNLLRHRIHQPLHPRRKRRLSRLHQRLRHRSRRSSSSIRRLQ